MPRDTIVRAFDGSLADAEGLLAVERATFDESPYNAAQVQAMLTGGQQRAWLAVFEDRVVGFVAAFSTWGLWGPYWEIDLLAVQPEWGGRGLATQLIRAAAAHGVNTVGPARAVVAADNAASARAFSRAGFRRAQACTLLICRLQGLTARPWTALDVSLREAATVEEATRWLPANTARVIPAEQGRCMLTLFLAERSGQPVGYAELLGVQTLLYRGLWIESLAATKRTVRGALVHQALNKAIEDGLDEIGMMVPEGDRAMREALLAAGFRSLGSFDWFRTGPAQPDPASVEPMEEGKAWQSEADDV